MIYLMRHGQDDERYIGGWSEVNLTEKGKEEVILAGRWIKNNLRIKKIMTSDVRRAVETAKIISSILNIPYEMDVNLREQNKGLLNGMEQSLAKEKYADLLENVTVDTVYPQGESLRNLYERVKKYLNIIKNGEDGTLIITHRGFINMIYFLLNNQDVDMDKKQFRVTTASIHELILENNLIRKVR